MKIFIGICCAILGVLLIAAYLGPDDIQNCMAPTDEAGECQKADAIVVVSGGDTDARVAEAVKLYNSGWSSTLIFSGAAADKTGPSNAEAMRRFAIANNVKPEDIVIEEQSETTRANAELTRRMIIDRGMERIVLVTSGYHQRRANLEFNRAFSRDAVAIINHPVRNDRQWSSTFWWASIPGWWLALSELVKVGLFYVGVSQ